MSRPTKNCIYCGKPGVTLKSKGCIDCVAGSRLAVMPVDFPKYAAGHSNSDCMKKFSAAHRTISRWREKCGVPTPGRLKICPSDFAKKARDMTHGQAMENWEISRGTLSRWCKESGVVLKTSRSPENPKPERVKKHRQRITFVRRALMEPQNRHNRNMSLAGRAVDECLRRQGPVIRCGPDGNYKESGDYYRFRSRIMNADQTVELAKDRYGWDADAWRAVA